MVLSGKFFWKTFRVDATLAEEPDGHLLLDVGPLEDFAELLERNESVLKRK